ncbi:gliding motility-associated C-terminal domain-containing protein [Formosa algae]|uniref:gliding motility-associated C-terminal domain-containing protein n=1 Tax=Formosa algae TaxID=225843 RepID=UPI000CCF2881|nr:gliding motility-associated C-terminal domain-containing protein [Formosa algae]PNW25886.1 hypothetical protein BKP44_18800 [Formosa algae]
MIYVDIDGDPTTVNSSSATIQLKNESGQVVDNTSNIVYAGLYWTGRPPGQEFIVNNPNNGLTNTLNKSIVSLKGPGSSGYTDVTANSVDIYYPEGSFNDMYIAYADVTGFVQSNGTGEYTVADIALVEGQDDTVGLGIGYYGGWSMVIVYENSSMRNRNIGVFDGYSFKGVPNDPDYELLSYIDLDISALNTADNVNAKIGVMGAEGDADLAGDALTTQYGGTGAYIQRLSHSTNTTTNFFNSSINVDGFPRTPNDPVFGIDLSKFDLPEPSVIPGQNNLSIQYTATTDKYVVYNLTLAFETVTLPEPPEDATYECIADVPVMEDLIADDVCSDTGGTITSVNTQTTNSTDPCNVIITRTWSFTNSCGDTSSVSQTINIIDTTAPIAPEAPADITVACLTDLPTDLELEATDNCGTIITAVGVDNIVSSSDGGCNQSVIRTWTFEDQCGNSSEISQNITVIDDVAPIFLDAPQDIVYDCDGEQRIPTIDAWVQLNGYGLATDNCSGITWTNNYDSTTPTCNESVTVEFTATDACGNSISQSATYTVLDETGPVIGTEPEALVLECNENSENVLNTWLTSNGGGLATDACSTDVTWSNDFNEDTFNLQACGEDNATTVTFTATDYCGNITSTTATITVTDVTAPTLPTNVPADVEVECYDDVPATINLTATDECAGEITVSGIDTEDNTDPTNIIITRTWTFTDACGNTSEVSQMITVSDITAPVIDNIPTDLAVECLSDVPAMEALTATDNCAGIITSNGTETINDTDACNVIITRNWVFTDDSGNSTETTQTITVKDETAPIVDSVPADMTIDCNDALPTMEALTATDNCAGTITAQGTETVDDSGALFTIITRTWTFTDDCGNATEATQTISVEKDVTAPVVDNAPADLTLECIDDVPTMEALTATDDCVGVITSNGTETINDADACNVIITRNWVFTDNSGNSTEVSQTITVADTQAPIVPTIPADITIECSDELPVMIDLTAQDNCGAEVIATPVDVTDNTDPCNVIITRTWTFEDACGNVSTGSQTINVIDETAPTLIEEATDIVYNCSGEQRNATIEAWVSLNGYALAQDNCSDITWTNNYDPNIISCEAPVEVIFTATDACGNSTSTTATYTINDETGPTIETEPQDLILACFSDTNTVQDWLNTNGGATAFDYCSDTITWSNDFDASSLSADACGIDNAVTVTFTAVDYCGNVTQTTATIAIIDETAPVLTTEVPADVTIECYDDIPAMISLTATDECAGDITVTGVDTEDNTDPTNIIITRTWTFEDACGNTTEVSQTITVNDATAPVVDSTIPTDLALECLSDVPAMETLTATDNCVGTITSDGTEIINDADACNVIITRTWIFMDNSGNTTEVNQTITVKDETAPVVTTPPTDMTIECDGDIPALEALTAIDNCAGELTSEGTETINTTDPLNTIITRTWLFTDACGNSTEVSQTITVKDVSAPVVDPMPEDVTYACIDDVPTLSALTAIDNCSGELTSEGTETIEDADACNVTITRTWMFTDESGNETEVTQTITVIDDVAPTAPAAPADLTVQCIDDVPVTSDLTATDNCGEAITSTGVDTVTDIDSCSSIITRTWSFTDSCGNTSTTTQIITVEDTIAPTLVSDLDTEVEIFCSDIPTQPELDFTDNCASTLDVEYTEVSTATGAAFENYLIIRDWTVTDTCGNAAVFTQTITVNVQQDVVLVTDDRCTEGGAVDLDSYLVDSSIDGTWVVTSGDTTINGSTYDPIDSEVGASYEFTFTEADGCQNQTTVTITVNEDCVEPTCDPIVSTTVTPNGDQWNEYFTITGLDRCGFVIDVEIYNRWGALVYKAQDYQNNWNGKNDKGAFGNANNLPTGTYYYIVTLKNSGLKPLTGSIYLGTK